MYKVTYNDTDRLFVFKDRYYKNINNAVKAYMKWFGICDGKVSLKDEESGKWYDFNEIKRLYDKIPR